MHDTSVRLSDGRLVGYAECGDPAGAPVLYLHGAPGSRVEAGPESVLASDYARAGIRLIGMERAGYGISTAQPGRHFADIVADIEAFANQLELYTFVVIGWSSGGPHALAAGGGLPDRVSAVGAIASIAPLAAVGWDGWGERPFVELAMNDPEALRALMKELAIAMRSNATDTADALLASIMSDADVAYWREPANKAVMTATLVEAARQDYEGYADDCIAGTTDWGFDLTDVNVPVRLLHGTVIAWSRSITAATSIRACRTPP